MVWLKQTILGDEIPKESMHYTCITCITIDSVMRMERKNYLQVYLEKYKYKSNKIKMTKFIDTELGSDSETGLESDTELESKLESDSDSESAKQPSHFTLNNFCLCFNNTYMAASLISYWLCDFICDFTNFEQIKKICWLNLKSKENLKKLFKL